MKKMISRRSFLAAAGVSAAALALTACGGAASSTALATGNTDASSAAPVKSSDAAWPTRPVNITVAASAGGATDVIARKYAEKFQTVTGQPMVITNISGASAYITSKTASADGYNFGTLSTAFLSYKHDGKVDFSWDEGYDTAAMYGISALMGFVVPKNSSFQTVNDLVEYAKENPGKLTVGNGNATPYYWQLAFQRATDIDLYTVHLGDTNELNVALLGGNVDVIVSRYAAVKAYIESGDFRMLCIGTENRSELAPDIPTCKESGIDFTYSPEMVALVCPKGTPLEAREGMNKVFAEMQSDPEFVKAINAMGQEVSEQMDIDELEKFISAAQDEVNEVLAIMDAQQK